MMEIVHGRRERYYCDEDDEQDPSKRPPFTPSSSSSSSTCWAPQLEPGESAAATVATTTAPVEREHMFDKVVTPSDVGKLNRLVIPKTHAEKYFPLDLATGDKGLMLCFEEGGTGKPWRFRYSYWNSSQSYVMTKGWSRFVKEKRLDAGDTVSFGRGVGEPGRGRLFIDWRHRPVEPHRSLLPSMMPLQSVVVPWGGGWGPFPPPMYGGSSSGGGSGGQYLYYRSAAAPVQAQLQYGGFRDGPAGQPVVLNSVPVVQPKAEPKRVRLFGVNLDCPEPEVAPTGYGYPPPHTWMQPHPPTSPPPPPSQRSGAPSLELDLKFNANHED